MHHFKPNPRFEVQTSNKLGRHLVAAKDLKAGESIFTDEPFVVGPNNDTSLLCFNCYLPLISKFVVCKNCAVAPICPGDGCPEELHIKWHSAEECNVFRTMKLSQGLHPMSMVQNVGSLLVLRALLKMRTKQQAWDDFMAMETHLENRRGTNVWKFCENTVEFINSLMLIESNQDADLIQKICAAIDVNSFEVRGPPIPSIGCSEVLRGVYLKGALLAHDCTANTHMSINDSNLMVCRASVDIKKGDVIYYNYTDPLKDELLLAEKYLKSSLEMLFIEPGNSPEGELCAKALEEYRALKATICNVLDAVHADGKTYTIVENSSDIVVK